MSGYSTTEDLLSTVHTTNSIAESDDDDFDFAYPSARAGQTRSNLSRRRLDTTLSPNNREAEDGNDPEQNEDHPQSSTNLGDSAGILGDFSKPGIDFLKDPPSQMTIGRKIALKLQNKRWYNPRAGLNFSKYDDAEVGGVDLSNLPSLQKAWAYFEHVVLTRYVVESHNTTVEGWGPIRKFLYSFKNFNEEFERARPGENQRPTKMYDPIATPHMQVSIPFLLKHRYQISNVVNLTQIFRLGSAWRFWLGFWSIFQCKVKELIRKVGWELVFLIRCCVQTLRAIGYILFVAGCISMYNIVYFASDNYSVPGSLSSNPLLYTSCR